MSSKVLIVLSFFLICFFRVGAASEPGNDLTISGRVEDSAGRAVPQARVVLMQADQGIVQEIRSDGEGHFAFHAVKAGPYQLKVESAGFAVEERKIAVAGSSMEVVIRLRVAGDAQTVTVHDEPGYTVADATTGLKMNIPLMETPLAIQVVDRQVLDDQQTLSLTDALLNVSGITATNDSFGTSDSFSVRGFDSAALLYQDGERMDEYSDSGFPQDMVNVDSVEVLKGPASVLYGQGQPGGLVNVVTKKPGHERFFRSSADGNLPLIADKLAARMVFERTDAQSFRKFGFLKELAFYPSLEWDLGKRVQATLRSSYQRGGSMLDPGIPFLSPQTGLLNQRIVAIAGPAKVPVSSNFIDQGTNDGLNWQYDVRPDIRVHLGEETDLHVAYKFFYTQADSNPPMTEVYQGDAGVPGNGTGTLGRWGFLETYFDHRTDQVTADLPVHFKVAGTTNHMMLGYEMAKDYGSYDYNSACPQTIDIYAPVYNQPVTYGPSCWLYGYGWNKLGYFSEGAYFQDFAQLPHHVYAMGGLRMNWANSFENYYAYGSSPGYTNVHDRPLNPRGGLLWQPIPQVSFYSNYASNYGNSGPSSNAPGQKFLPPQSAGQVEFGVKTELLDKKLTATAAVYRIIQHNVPGPDPKNPAVTIAIGTDRTQGVEVDVTGQLTKDLRVVTSFSNLQDIVTGDTNSLELDGVPNQKGLPFDGVARVTGSVWATWEPHSGPLRGLMVGGGLNGHSAEHFFQYVSLPVFLDNPTACQAYPADPTQCVTGFEDDRVPGSSLVNLMAAYKHAWGLKKLSVQVNVHNLTSNYSFSSLGYEGALPNTPLQILPELEFKF